MSDDKQNKSTNLRDCITNDLNPKDQSKKDSNSHKLAILPNCCDASQIPVSILETIKLFSFRRLLLVTQDLNYGRRSSI